MSLEGSDGPDEPRAATEPRIATIGAAFMHETTQILTDPAPIEAGPARPATAVFVPREQEGGWGVCELPTLGTLRVEADHGDKLRLIEAALAQGAAGELPGNRWAGFLGYGLGGVVEPRTGVGPGVLPLAELHRVARGVGLPLEPAGELRCGSVRSVQGRANYVAAVERALKYIEAGDIYQANIAHELRGHFSGSASDLYAALVRGARPKHGLCVVGSPLEDGTSYAVLSLSPELFLSFDARTRRLVTRPMKGTRPGDGDETELRDAIKDRAELAMIVDLMRNDLGRVCEFGSVRVDEPRRIERHGSGSGAVLQATATVSGTVRAGVDIGEIIAATFAPGSVTGTPKVRAMQVIDELEGFDRGPYCGCVGTFADDGSFELAVSIRTAVVTGPVNPQTGEFVDADFTYCVGAGIVADSDPQAEWEETLAKARVLEPVFQIEELTRA